MKKLLLVIMMLFSLTLVSCNDESDCEHNWKQTDSTEDAIIYTCDKCGDEKKENINEHGLSSVNWQSLQNEEYYKNYTVEYSSYLEKGGVEQQYNKYKITDTYVSLTARYSGQVVLDDVAFTIEESNEQRELYKELFIGLLGYADKFTYVESEKVYTCSEDITVDITMNLHQASLTCIFKNTVIKVDANKMLASIEGNYVQITNVPGQGEVTIECYAVFNLFDYGTTVANTQVDVE